MNDTSLIIDNTWAYESWSLSKMVAQQSKLNQSCPICTIVDGVASLLDCI